LEEKLNKIEEERGRRHASVATTKTSSSKSSNIQSI